MRYGGFYRFATVLPANQPWVIAMPTELPANGVL